MMNSISYEVKTIKKAYTTMTEPNGVDVCDEGINELNAEFCGDYSDSESETESFNPDEAINAKKSNSFNNSQDQGKVSYIIYLG